MTERWKLKSNSSSVLRAGEAAGADAAGVGHAAGVLGLRQRVGELLVANQEAAAIV